MVDSIGLFFEIVNRGDTDQARNLLNSLKDNHELGNYSAFAFFLDGFLLEAEGKSEEALLFLKQQILLTPLHYESRILQIKIFIFQNKIIEAKKCIKEIGELINSSSLTSQQALEIAILSYRAGDYQLAENLLTGNPHLIEKNCDALDILGCIELKLNNPQQALKYFRDEMELNPTSARAHYNISVALRQLRSINLALYHLERARSIDPVNFNDLTGLYYCASILMDFEKKDYYGKELIDANESQMARDPFALLMLTDDGDILKSANQYFASRYYYSKAKFLPPTHKSHIRVGYVSSDFKMHATSFLIENLLRGHDRGNFEIFAFDFTKETGTAYQSSIQNLFDERLDISALNDSEAAKLIRESSIDILIDLKGYTEGARFGIFARRPCNTQVSYLGYPGTSGSPAMDYLIGDQIVTPNQFDHFYSENIIELPCCYQPNTANRSVGPMTERASHGLPSDATIFCSFNYHKKLNSDILYAWSKILSHCNESLLWILESEDDEKFIALLEQFGISKTRIVLAPRLPPDRHLERLRHASIFLDSFPCGAHTTASDALFWGVPVVTILGRAFQSRVASSIMHHAGGEICVTASFDDYISRAIELHDDAELLRKTRVALLDKEQELSPYNVKTLQIRLERAFKHIHMMDQPKRISREFFTK